MKVLFRLRAILQFVLVVFWVIVPQKKINAQAQCEDMSGKLSLEINLSPALENAQVLGLASLGIDSKGAGPDLISGTMINNTDELLTNLFFEFEVQAGKVGTIARVTQQAAYPFTLDPRQVVYATNNQIQNEEIPGISEKMNFNGGLTVAGEEFLESLGGTTNLPEDVYTISVNLFQVTNACGKVALASEVVELGISETGGVVEEKSIFLRTPGDVVGTNVTITNQFPQMSWEGDASSTYRVVVVSGAGQDTPETLIQGAKSTSPTNEGGSLLEFEHLDLKVTGNTFQYPASGVQALKVGQKYYWQVSTEVQTASGADEIISEVWSFSLTDPGSEAAATTEQMDEETYLALIALIGEERYNTLLADGFFFEGIEAEGQIMNGATAILLLAEIKQKIEDGDIIIEE